MKHPGFFRAEILYLSGKKHVKRIKIVTNTAGIGAIGLLQLTSGGLFFNSLKNDKNFTVLQTIRQRQSALNATSGWSCCKRVIP